MLENTVAPAEGEVLGLSAEPVSPERRLAWAGALSACAHLALFLFVGLASPDSVKRSAAPELSVFVVSQDRGRNEEHDRAGPVAAPAAPTAAFREQLLSATDPSRSASVRSQPPDVVVTAPPADASPGPPSADGSTAEDSAPSDSPPQEAAVVTTIAPSDSEAPVRAEPSVPPASVAVRTVEQSVLTRWVMQSAQKLQDVNLQQARLSLQHEGREYVAQLQRRPAADSMDLDRVIVEITTEENGKRLRTQLQLKRLAFSHFAQLVDQWDTRLQFHEDEILGRFHSNSQINIGYDHAVAPRFLLMVSSAARGYTVGNTEGYRPQQEIFRGGFAPHAGHIALPSSFSPPPSEAGGGQPFAHDTRITFYPDGSYGWRELGVDGPEHRQSLSTPAHIIAARHATLCVKGTVHGKVLVYSPERIVIEGNLVYAHDPRQSADADDYLGLLSGKDVEIGRPQVTGPGDLQVNAAVYARRRFVVTDEDAPRHGTLLIYGSLTAGSLSATEPRYATRYEYDTRFEYQRPPGFPVTQRYELDSWDTQWHEVLDEASAEDSPPPPSG